MPLSHAQRCIVCGQLFVTLADLFNHQREEAFREVEEQRHRRRPEWPPTYPRPLPQPGRPFEPRMDTSRFHCQPTLYGINRPYFDAVHEGGSR